jgi:hypothetical protein
MFRGRCAQSVLLKQVRSVSIDEAFIDIGKQGFARIRL